MLRAYTSVPARAARLVLSLLIVFLVLPATGVLAKDRHALVIGIGGYTDANGLNRLIAPANDANEIKFGLENKAIGYVVDALKDADLPNKAAFKSAFDSFLSRIQPDDEVLVYFSGHGVNVPDKGNFYLLPDAKSEPAFLIEYLKKNPLEAKVLDTQDKKTRRYQEWIAEVALSENEIETAIRERTQGVIVFVADACRTLVSGSEGAAIVSGAIAPKETTRGVFKLYSAGGGQSSYERPEEVAGHRTKSKKQEKKEEKAETKKDRTERRKLVSLYTQTFLRALPTPRVDISILQSKIRLDARGEARTHGTLQVPAFSQDAFATPFFFWQGDDEADISARCSNDKNELDSLRYGVITGSVSRESIEYKWVDLAPCGHEKVVAAYLRLQQQGAGASGVPTIGAKGSDGSGEGGGGDAGQRCDELAASQYDKDRPEGIAGTEVQNIALAGLAGDAAAEAALKAIGVAIDACTRAVKEHELVARFKFNLARAIYAKSILTPELGRDEDLRQVSRNVREAADLGHAAAYHMLAMLYLNGEYYEATAAAEPQEASPDAAVGQEPAPDNAQGDGKLVRQPPDREQARAWLQRGADLGHVLALYELGLAYDNGELDVNTDQLVQVKSEAKAYQHYSRAAEAGFIPAMIQAALILASPRNTDDVPQNTNRAMEMLTQAAARGSPEAMYRMGQLSLRGSGYYDEHTVPRDENEAFVWFSRAADFGDSRAQERVADMLRKGMGLPAQQPESAARYWRLAADGGSLSAQMELANLLRDGQVPFRLRVKIGSDGGAEEIRRLYMGAFARGNPEAGLELARLFRKGFPAGGKVGGKATSIPKNPEIAVALLWETMTRIRHMPDDSEEANPEKEFQAAAELISMYDAGETNVGGRSLITQDQIDQLRADYGDPAKSFWIRASSLGAIRCRRGPYYVDEDKIWVRIWDSKRLDPPTEEQFDWFEKSTACKERVATEKIKSKGKARELGVSNKVREAIKKEYDAAAKDREKNPDTYKKFTDRMADLVTKRGKKQ